LWSITVPLNTVATTTTSTLDWTSTAYPIRAIAYNGTNGSNGVNGTRTAILDMYKWSATTPVVFPVGASTYTWATGQFTAPGTPNGWYLTPPAAVVGETLWIARTVYADNNSTATTNITWTATNAFSAGAAGTNGDNGDPGANGYRTAFLELYKWSAVVPNSFPAGNSTYTWATGVFTAPTTPNGWQLEPGASTPGYILYACSVRYADTNTTDTSVVTWNTGSAYAVGAAGTNGSPGAPGDPGSNGAATFVVVRAANDSSAPTNSEVFAVIGRNPVAGDIVTVSYNNYNNATVYRFTTSWVLFSTYITGSLIVENTITASKMVTGIMSADNTLTRGLTVRDTNGNILLASGTPLNYANITPATGWLNSNITVSGGAISGIGTGSGTVVANNAINITDGLLNGIGTGTGTAVANSGISLNANGTLSGAGGGAVTAAGINAVNTDLSNAPAGILNSSVTLGTLGAGAFAYLDAITTANVTTYISGAAIGTAQIGVLTAGNIGAGTIDASKVAANSLTAGQIAANTITAAQIAANTITANELSSITVSASKNIKVGTAAVSGTTMTGSGGILNGDGTLALGNSTTNISFNGTQMTLNGNVVATGNINLNAVTTTAFAQKTSTSIYNAGNFPWGTPVLASASVDTNNSPLVIIASSQPVAYVNNPEVDYATFKIALRVNGTIVRYLSPSTATSYVANTYTATFYISSPGTGSLSIELIATDLNISGGSITFYPSSDTNSGSYFYTLGTKR
jgi:hypothetical protein